MGDKVDDIQVGERLELLWAVDGESHWWGCEVKSVDPETGILSVLYDAYQEFEVQASRLKVLAEHYIQDLGVNEELPYRKQGDTWDDVVNVDEALGGEPRLDGTDDDTLMDAVDLLPKDGEQTMQEVLDIQNLVDPGGQLQALGLEELGKMDPAKQRVFADDYVKFKTFLSGRLQTLIDTKGKGYTVGSDDINAILRDFKHTQGAPLE